MHHAWIRISVLLVCAALLVAAIYARRDEVEPNNSLAGLTGQRQQIIFSAEPGKRPHAFTTTIYTQCAYDPERRTDWSPGAGAPVPFKWHGRRLTVRETKAFDYGKGYTGTASNIMRAVRTGGRVDGIMRSVWRFSTEGREYEVCDSGNVPFVAGDSFSDRLDLVGPRREPWTLYPVKPLRHRSLRPGPSDFARRVDASCSRTWRELQDAIRDAARRWRFAPIVVQEVYVRYHAAQLRALEKLGDAPSDSETYRAWLNNFRQRVKLDGRELYRMYRGDLAGAAEVSARMATLKAEGQAAGIEFGLGACVSLGPAGSPTS